MLNANALRTMAELLDEAAGHLRAVMESGLAEQRQVRHFLPDELEGLAIMLREQAADGVPGMDPLGQPGVDDGGPYNGLAAPGVRVDTPYHCAPEDIDALLRWLDAINDPQQEALPSLENTDWRGRAGVIARVIRYLCGTPGVLGEVPHG